MSTINTRVVTGQAEFNALADDWDRLLLESGGSNSLFLTYEWISALCKQFDNDTRLNIVIIERDGKPEGIFPLKKVQYRLGIARFKVLETIGTSNSNPVGFFNEEGKEQIIAALADYLIMELHKGFAARLMLVPDDCTFIALLKEKMPQLSNAIACITNTVTVAPFISLKPGWEEYFRSLSKNRRKRLRKILDYANNGHTIEFGRFHGDSIPEGLNKLFDLHIKRWKSLNIKSPFLYEGSRNFYKDIAARFDNSGWLNFTFLRIDGEIRSLIFAVIYGGKLYSATIARDPGYPEFNLGHLHHYFMIKEAFDKGLEEYDFLRGDELHKFHWTQQWRKYERVIVARRSRIGRIDIIYRAAVLRLLEVIENKHSTRELLGLISYQLKNRKLVKNILGQGKKDFDPQE